MHNKKKVFFIDNNEAIYIIKNNKVNNKNSNK